MTGWRVGWMVVPDALVRPVERLQQNLAISVPTLSQIAAAAAFDGRDEMEAVKHGYEENRRILVEGLPKAGLDQVPARRRRVLSLCRRVALHRRQLRIRQAHAGGGGRRRDARASISIRCDGKHFMRFCYAGSAADMREAVERIGHWLQSRLS